MTDNFNPTNALLVFYIIGAVVLIVFMLIIIFNKKQ